MKHSRPKHLDAQWQQLKRDLRYADELFKRNDDSYTKHKKQLQAEAKASMDEWRAIKGECTQLRLFK
jgi:hypothetical protein